MKDVLACATILDEASRTGRAVPQLTATRPELSIADAYEIQNAAIGLRVDRGETVAGFKMGLTSTAKMRQVGVDSVICGVLLSGMRIGDTDNISLAGRIHARIEPEIAFIMKKPLAGRVSAAEAMNAVEAVAPALEVIDSRYADFRFNLADVIADNASASGFVLGNWSAATTDVSNLGIALRIDGRMVLCGSSAAILGHPFRALVEAARLAAETGKRLEPGAIVLAGAATEAIPLRAKSHVEVVVQKLGSAAIQVGAD